MSNAKKLSYEMQEPAFLRRMRNAATVQGQADRYIAPRNRKITVEDGEDAPAYVLEDGQSISKDEFEHMGGHGSEDEEKSGSEGEKVAASSVVGKDGEEGGKPTSTIKETPAAALRISLVAEVGAKKKRRAAKIVGGDGEDDDDDDKSIPRKEKPRDASAKGKPAKGKRRVKLSFGDE